MSLSFRTNGNFIDFVNTDATSLNVETVIMSLHNTSRCIDWSLPVDTTKISFTIDEVKYSNISITEIDFDGTVMNSQDDFETGITGMFEGLAGGSGGGEGMALEEYDNSAMSAPVMAYVFKDEDDNICRVYEPIRNNDVSRKTYAYADSIDLFAFDSVNNFANVLNDVKLIDVPVATKFQGCTLGTMIIDANSHTGLQLINQVHKGNYGVAVDNSVAMPNNAEYYITGDNVIFKDNTCHNGVWFDSLGTGFIVNGNTFQASSFIKAEGSTNGLIDRSSFGAFASMYQNSAKDGMIIRNSPVETDATFEITANNVTCNYCFFGANCFVSLNTSVTGCVFGNSSTPTINTDGGALIQFCVFGPTTNVTSTSATNGRSYILIGNTTYLQGEAAGAMTLTAV